NIYPIFFFGCPFFQGSQQMTSLKKSGTLLKKGPKIGFLAKHPLYLVVLTANFPACSGGFRKNPIFSVVSSGKNRMSGRSSPCHPEP
ncbi:MAG: hypothetical protein ACP5HM_14420, partial [Anaerolineae bacterium]